MAGMNAFFVRLDPKLHEFVVTQAQQDAFASAEAYIVALIRQRYEQETAIADLLRELDPGLADIEAGRVLSVEEAFDGLKDEPGVKDGRHE